MSPRTSYDKVENGETGDNPRQWTVNTKGLFQMWKNGININTLAESIQVRAEELEKALQEYAKALA